MTIAALLRHHGIDVPRFVTVDGTIVFDGVLPDRAGGFRHSTLGVVTPVAPHVFHGGTQTPDKVTGSARRWWEDELEIQRHQDAMASAFPGFMELPREEAPPAWGGVIDTGRGRFRIMVVCRRDQGIPAVIPVTPARLGKSRQGHWTRTEHLYDKGNLCVADSADWDPSVHTVATAVAWAAHWLAAYTEWRMSDRWPIAGCTADVAA
jgi:hypothetical protein